MKKIKFISAIALTVLMASCDDFDLPNPPGQTNPEPAGVFEASGLVLNAGQENVDLVQANNENKDVVVATIAELVNFPSEYDLVIEMEVSPNDSFNPVTTVATTILNNEVGVNPDIFNGAVQKVKTKAPGTYDMNVRFVGYAVKGNTKMRLGGLTQTYCPEVLKVKTLDAAKVIEDNYYLVPCDAAGKPQLAKAMKMNNTSGEGVSPYDNPEWALKIDVTEAEAATGYMWKIAPQSAVTAGNTDGLLGCLVSVDNELAGKLGAGYGAGVITLQGPVLVTVNIEADSYGVSYAFNAVYAENTKPQDALPLYTDNYITYQGVSVLNTVFYIYGQPSRDGVVFKQNPDVQPEISEDGKTQTGLMTAASGGTQIRTPVKGTNLYWVDLNLVQLTYKVTCLETLSVIGSGNGWNLETAAQLTPSKDKKVWTAENVEVGDMFKINANGAWDIDFGGEAVQNVEGKTIFNVHYKGGNLEVTPGTYKVTVDFRAVPYTVTLE